MPVELNHLKYFHVVARERGFTRASRILRVQQPTISKMVRNLEMQLGVPLLDRQNRGTVLTPAGVRVFRICEEIFERVNEIQLVNEVVKTEYEGPLAFGVTDSVSSYLVPSILSTFLKDKPKVRPSMFAGSSNLICSEILDDRIEFGIFFTSPEFTGFHVTELISIPFFLVIAADKVKSPSVRRSFVISREIDYPKSRPFPVLEMLRRNHIEVETVIASNNLDAQKEMVKQGLGVALLPGFMVKSSIEKGTLAVMHPKKTFAYSLKLVHRKGKALSRNSRDFLDIFRVRAREWA